MADQADGQVLPLIEATLKVIYERKSGTSQRGDWSIQNGVLTDGTNEVPIQLKDRDEMPQSMKGKVLRFEASNTQHGLNGVKVFDDTYNGTTTRKLKITPSANVTVADGFADPTPQPEHEPEPQQHQQPPQQHDPAPQPEQQQAPAEKAHEELAQAKFTLVQVTNLHVLCRMAIEKQEAPLIKRLTGRDMGEGEMQAATSSLFIKMDRLGMHNKMPRKPFTAQDFTR